MLTVTPDLGYAVAGQTRLVHIDRDGAVSEPEIFREGGVGPVRVDGRAVRLLVHGGNQAVRYGAGELSGYGLYVLGRTI